ncbi:hypothetical protein [Cytobacillus firmus]|uniref:Uncharacterized protein n=1 Tax=Cytobacillus firmus DS1 TaxID=1307436 RepID=W7L019_CYTFI|nr:hypothetical protein [Cytobacillus firmus]EWG08881.1 hypothetical protein PBF_21993 [Cytobacillus firmus DS1]
MLVGDKNCKVCKGYGLIGTFNRGIDDNDLEPCECVKEWCPNCDIELEEKGTPDGKMIACGICSYGWYIG